MPFKLVRNKRPSSKQITIRGIPLHENVKLHNTFRGIHMYSVCSGRGEKPLLPETLLPLYSTSSVSFVASVYFPSASLQAAPNGTGTLVFLFMAVFPISPASWHSCLPADLKNHHDRDTLRRQRSHSLLAQGRCLVSAGEMNSCFIQQRVEGTPCTVGDHTWKKQIMSFIFSKIVYCRKSGGSSSNMRNSYIPIHRYIFNLVCCDTPLWLKR